jgi:hypothetical protein
LNALVATVSTPLAAPVVAATRLRGGTANSARGAAWFVAEAINTARSAGCSGRLIVRADSAFYSAAFVGACRRAGANFSVTVTMDPKIKAAIAAIPAGSWQKIRYPNAVWDEDAQAWISDAEVAEVEYAAFASRRKHAVTARLLVRRVPDRNPTAHAGQDELFTAWRYHAVFTDSPYELVQAEAQHRDHAIVEQVFADLLAGPLAHLPSGRFPANAAWLALAGLAHNLARATGASASALGHRVAGRLPRHRLATRPPSRLSSPQPGCHRQT